AFDVWVPWTSFLSSLCTASTSSKVILPPTFPSSFSTRTVSPGATRYCLPPLRITAYMNPPKLLAETFIIRTPFTSVNAEPVALRQVIQHNQHLRFRLNRQPVERDHNSQANACRRCGQASSQRPPLHEVH